MTSSKVVKISSRRRRPPSEAEDLEERIRALEEELKRARSRRPKSREGLLVALARIAEAGSRALTWERVARLWQAVYFSYHSEETDEFGYDRKFAESVRLLFEFLYTVWWRVEATGIEHVPPQGPGLIVANHSGVLPWDGLMINLAVRHEHPARRECRLLALDMFALLPFFAPMLSKGGAVRASQENGRLPMRCLCAAVDSFAFILVPPGFIVKKNRFFCKGKIGQNRLE